MSCILKSFHCSKTNSVINNNNKTNLKNSECIHDLSGLLSKKEVLLEALSSLYYPSKASFSLGPQQAQTITCSFLPLQPQIDSHLQTTTLYKRMKLFYDFQKMILSLPTIARYKF
jgi:hypothetical protein